MNDILEDAPSLFSYLRDLAREQTNKRVLLCQPWVGKRAMLSDFLPPVQAALSVSLAQSLSETEKIVRRSGEGADVFPAYVPRMRAFHSTVQVMVSKAKPKKLTAFAVAGGRVGEIGVVGEAGKGDAEGRHDLGEMHFLLKREDTGDLRKDARVQDLNNVINRILKGGGKGGGANEGGRKLHLRTFSVTCLSEDCGIIEWVPDTDSLRNVVSKTYNPQAPVHSERRRGARISDFGDVRLRDAFLNCQNAYVVAGNLTKAGKMFVTNCLRPYPPVLYWYFVQKFTDPHKWFEARRRFTLSCAVWSAVGHIIGLGDRHSENILIDTSSGDCVHVDFDW